MLRHLKAFHKNIKLGKASPNSQILAMNADRQDDPNNCGIYSSNNKTNNTDENYESCNELLEDEELNPDIEQVEQETEDNSPYSDEIACGNEEHDTELGNSTVHYSDNPASFSNMNKNFNTNVNGSGERSLFQKNVSYFPFFSLNRCINLNFF